MKKKIFRITIAILLALGMIFSFPITVYAATDTSEETSEESTDEGYDLIGELTKNVANAKIDEDKLGDVNEELFGDRNHNPLEFARDSLNKFVSALSGKSYNSSDFGGNADKVYGGITEGVDSVANDGILDAVYDFGKSCVNLIVNIISSAAQAISN